MGTNSGYSNKKMRGQNRHATFQNIGSDRVGLSAPQMYLYELTTSPLTISAVALSTDQKVVRITFSGSHLANKWDVLRITNGDLIGWEFEIINVVSATVLDIHNIGEINSVVEYPEVSDGAKTYRWTTALSDSTGSLQVSPGPTQFTRNGATQTVIEDTTTAANNKPLPSGMYILIDGVAHPVGIDTGTPANTVMIPVQVSGVSGPINITAGDLNVQLSSEGANFDATRIGDGSGIYLKIEADGSVNTNDPNGLAELTLIKTSVGSIDTKTPALGQALMAASVPVTLASNQPALAVTMSAPPTGGSTEAKQDAEIVLVGALTETAPATDTDSSGLNGRLQRIAQRITSMIALLPASLGQKASAASLAVVLSTEEEALIGSLTETAPATDTASSGLNGRLQRIAQNISAMILQLPATIGQKADAASLGVSLSTEQAGLIGALTETAPVSDTASSGLNGRLQRIAQNLSALILQLPATIGQKLMAASLSVTIASDQSAIATTQSAFTPTFQEITNLTTGLQTFTAPAGAKWFCIQTDDTNTANVRFKSGGSASATSGHQLQPGRSEQFPVSGNVTVFAESGTNQKVCITFGNT